MILVIFQLIYLHFLADIRFRVIDAMSNSSSSKGRSGPKTRCQLGSRMTDLVGPGKEMNPTEVPTVRAVLQRGVLLKEKLLVEEGKAKNKIRPADICKELAPLILAQWQKANPKFCPPIVIKTKFLVQKLERLWKRAVDVAHKGGKGKSIFEGELDKLLEVVVCQHNILFCDEEGSGCDKGKGCEPKAHLIECDCPLAVKVPTLELRWLAYQRRKRGEKSEMMMSSVDKVESQRQELAAKRKAAADEAQTRKRKKEEEEERLLTERQQEFNNNMVELEDEMGNCEVEPEEHYTAPITVDIMNLGRAH